MTTILQAPATVIVRTPDRKPCEHCGGEAGFKLDAGKTGAGFDSNWHDHAPDCCKVVCPCGVPWRDCVVNHDRDELSRHYQPEGNDDER
jgi:hypothetical protein